MSTTDAFKPSVTLTVDAQQRIPSEIGATEPFPNQTKTMGMAESSLPDTLSELVTDRALMGLKDETTQSERKPFHTSGNWTRPHPLQNMPKPGWKEL